MAEWLDPAVGVISADAEPVDPFALCLLPARRPLTSVGIRARALIENVFFFTRSFCLLRLYWLDDFEIDAVGFCTYKPFV